MRALTTFTILLLAVCGHGAIFSPGLKTINAPTAGYVLHVNSDGKYYWAAASATATNALNSADTTQFATNGQGKVTFKDTASVTNLTRFWGTTNREPTWNTGSHVPPGVGLYHDGVPIFDLRLNRGPNPDGAHTNIFYVGGPGAGDSAVSNRLFETQFMFLDPEGREAYLPSMTMNWADVWFLRWLHYGLTNGFGVIYTNNNQGNIWFGDPKWTNTLQGKVLYFNSLSAVVTSGLTVEGDITNATGTAYLNSIFTDNSISVGTDFTLGGKMEIFEQAAPGTPVSGSFYLYPKSDGKLYGKNDGGTEYDLTASSGSGEANVIGDAGSTNSTKISLSHSKAGVTNFVKTVQAGNGITATNEGTNIVFALTGTAGTTNVNAHASGSYYSTNGYYHSVTNMGTNASVAFDWNGPKRVRYWPSGNFTLDITNEPSAGSAAGSAIIEIFPTTTVTPTWDGLIDWRGAAPGIITGITNLFALSWNGTNWLGSAQQEPTTGSGATVLNTNATVSGLIQNAFSYSSGTNHQNSTILTNNIGRITRTVSGTGGATTNFVVDVTLGTVYLSAATNVCILFTNGVEGVEYNLRIVATNRTGTSRTIHFDPVYINVINAGLYTGADAPPYTCTNSQARQISAVIKGTNATVASVPTALPTN